MHAEGWAEEGERMLSRLYAEHGTDLGLDLTAMRS